MKQSRAKKLIDARIDRAYNATCRGIQINMLDISKIFAFGHGFLASNPGVSDEALGVRVREFVETIRVDKPKKSC